MRADQGGRGRRGHEIDALAVARDLLDRESGRRAAAVGQHGHALVIDPLPGLGAGDVGLVLVIGLQDFQGAAEQGGAEVFHCHLGGALAAGSADLAVGAAYVAEQADLDGGGDGLRAQQGGFGEGGGGHCGDGGAAGYVGRVMSFAHPTAPKQTGLCLLYQRRSWVTRPSLPSSQAAWRGDPGPQDRLSPLDCRAPSGAGNDESFIVAIGFIRLWDITPPLPVPRRALPSAPVPAGV